MAEPVREPNKKFSPERRLLIVQERLRHLEQLKLLEQITPTPDDAILDVGCSTGRFMQQLKAGGVQDVWGIDPDPAVANPEAHIVTASATNLENFPDKRFTKLVFAHSLEHIEDRRTALAEAHRVLQDDGELHVTLFLYDDQTYHLPGVRAAAPEMPPYLSQPTITEVIAQSGFSIEHEEVREQSSAMQAKAEVPTLFIKARKVTPANR